MTVVLDEGVPRSLAGALRAFGLDADPFDPAWIGLRNGVPLRRVEAAGYSVLLTNDKNMAFQQSLKGAGVAVVALPLESPKRRPGTGRRYRRDDPPSGPGVDTF